jgi:hypothetical protein
MGQTFFGLVVPQAGGILSWFDVFLFGKFGVDEDLGDVFFYFL